MTNRIIVVDPSDTGREVVARRLRAQGYLVEETGDVATGADMALCNPPAAVVADLWMPGISGVQLCRLLRSEPATAEVAVILCGDTDEPRHRFWADRAGANAYVPKHRTGDLVRALGRAIVAATPSDAFFFQLSGGTGDVRERIARHLDAALFDSVIASEIRALAAAGAFERLFDLFAQFLSQVSRYRWLALSVDDGSRLAIHHHPRLKDSVEAETHAAFDLSAAPRLLSIEDEDAIDVPWAVPPIVRTIPFGNASVGKVALSPCSEQDAAAAELLISLVARELGGPIRMAALVEESQRLASTDALTGLMNRRAFAASMAIEIARSQRHGYPMSLILLDVDHFKLVNDKRGHQGGDKVLAGLGHLLSGGLLRCSDLAARWGGEEFVVAFPSTASDGGATAAERVRHAIEQMEVDEGGIPIPVTASLGLVELRPGESLESLVERADRAMYLSKKNGRNRVTRDDAKPSSRPSTAVTARQAES